MGEQLFVMEKKKRLLVFLTDALVFAFFAINLK